MAGRGPQPKDPSRRARRNVDPRPATVLRFEHAPQPVLPEGVDWPDATRRWWVMWGGAAQSEFFSATDWDFLLDTALLHAAVWRGSLERLTELRLRVAKFGATPEDRARLRMQFAEADSADSKRPVGSDAVSRYGGARLVSLPLPPAPEAGSGSAG